MADDDDDEGVFGGIFEDGHWAWDDVEGSLVFVSDLPPEPVEIIQMLTKAPTGTIEFRDDIDLIEQITEEIAVRIIDQETKIRTKQSDIIENEYRDNLADLRLLVAKEYSTMIIGGADTKRLHHMGPHKKTRSLSNKDARLYETLLRMAVQIVWIALGRKSFNKIELEVNRIFKTEIFNSVEHILKTGYVSKMTKEERAVLLGQCLRHERKLNTKSPLMNEVFSCREVDYRLMGLGVIRYSNVSARLNYMFLIVAGPEEDLQDSNISLGIIGLPRSSFDTMLRSLPEVEIKESASSMSMKFGSPSKASAGSRSRTSVSKTSTKSQAAIKKLFPDIVLPPKQLHSPPFPKTFPEQKENIFKVSEIQRRRWQNRLMKLMHPNR